MQRMVHLRCVCHSCREHKSRRSSERSSADAQHHRACAQHSISGRLWQPCRPLQRAAAGNVDKPAQHSLHNVLLAVDIGQQRCTLIHPCACERCCREKWASDGRNGSLYISSTDSAWDNCCLVRLALTVAASTWPLIVLIDRIRRGSRVQASNSMAHKPNKALYDVLRRACPQCLLTFCTVVSRTSAQPAGTCVQYLCCLSAKLQPLCCCCRVVLCCPLFSAGVYSAEANFMLVRCTCAASCAGQAAPQCFGLEEWLSLHGGYGPLPKDDDDAVERIVRENVQVLPEGPGGPEVRLCMGGGG